jgi:hypothetical protein
MAQKTYKLFTLCSLVLACIQFQHSHGFTTITPTTTTTFKSKNKSQSSSSSFALQMSSIQKENTELPPQKQNKKFELPPLPEDHIILGGDILALFTYSFLDHVIAALILADAKDIYTEPNALTLPVWSDVVSNNFGPSLLTAITAQQEMADIGDAGVIAEANQALMLHHAPCLETFGVSAVLLGTCWLISGYFNRAFEYENTVSCHPSHAIVVTGKTWIFSAMMMLGLAVWSNSAFCGCQSLTRNDMDFIFDSLSVLVTWRFVASLVLGGFF